MRSAYLLVALGGLASCLVERQVLDRPEDQGFGGEGGSPLDGGAGEGGTLAIVHGGSGGGAAGFGNRAGMASGGMAEPGPLVWTDCLAALDGSDGDPCVPNSFPCEFRQGCHTRFAACLAPEPAAMTPTFTLTVGADDTCQVPCARDADCKPGDWCTAGTCAPCLTDGMCAPGWEQADRNGCSRCVPPSNCKSDADCGGGHCFAGLVCADDCNGDPSCCHGNLCAPPGCQAPPPLDCSVTGCKGDARCVVSRLAKCICDPVDAQWRCSPDPTGNFCK